MSRAGGIRDGKAFVELGIRNNLTAGLRSAQRQLRAFSASAAQIGGVFAGIGGGALAGLGALTGTFARVGDELDKTSRRTGLSVEALSRLGFAAEQSGSNLGTLEKGVRTLQRSIVDAGRGLATQTEAFERIGLSFEDLEDLGVDQQFRLVADRLGSVEDATVRAATAAQLLGRAGTQLLPLFEGGANGLAALEAQADSLGLTISGETATSAAELTDALNILRRIGQRFAVEIGAALAPSLLSIAETVTPILTQTIEWARENRGLIVTITGIAVGVTALGGAFLGLSAALGLASIGLGALLTPIPLVVGGIVAAGAAVVTFTGIGSQAVDFLRDRFGGAASAAVGAVNQIVDAFANGGIGEAARIAGALLNVAFSEGLERLTGAVTSVATGIVSTLSDAWVSLRAGAAVAIGGIRILFESLVGAARSAASVIANVFEGNFDIGSIAGQVADIQAETRSRVAEIAGETTGNVADVTAEARAQAERLAGPLEKIASGLEARAESRLRDARAALEDARANATEARREAGREGLAALIPDLAGANGGDGGLTTRGSVSGFSFRGLISGSTAVERTASAADRAADAAEGVQSSIARGLSIWR